MENHWHIVDSIISRHVVTAVEANYKTSVVTEYEWKKGEAPTCGECGQVLGGAR